MLDGFGEGAAGGRAGGVGFGRREDVSWEEGEAEAEVGGGEDGEGFDEDIGGRFVAREVGVELVSAVVPGLASMVFEVLLLSILGVLVALDRSDRANKCSLHRV